MKCNNCGRDFEAQQPQSINVGLNPELKASVKDGTLFVHECPFCGRKVLSGEPFLYHDPQEHLLLALTSSPLNVAEGLDGYTCRRVSSVGELIEKVNIFDAGLDDVVLELCKFVTLQELKKKVDLKFYRMEGSDGDITLAYPEKGEMQMIAIGYNVYSDCAGIVNRNPSLRKAASGLAKIDQDWISKFIA